MSRDYEVRQQGYAMERATDAHQYGDLKTFRGCIEEVTRAGHAMGIRSQTHSDFPKLGDETRHKGEVLRPVRRRRTKTIISI